MNHYYPTIKEFQLIDFKVRILGGQDGSAAKTRVLVETSDGNQTWGTVGVSANIIDATWLSITDSIEYGLWIKAKQENLQKSLPKVAQTEAKF